jgi:hypothetical protein
VFDAAGFNNMVLKIFCTVTGLPYHLKQEKLEESRTLDDQGSGQLQGNIET